MIKARMLPYKKYIPFIITVSILLFYHIFIVIGYGDDDYFKNVNAVYSLKEFWVFRYHEWTSRNIIETVLLVMVMHPLIWKICNYFFWCSAIYMILRLTNAKGENGWFACLLLLQYPFMDMNTAGWIATNVNYLWPLWCILFAGMALKRIMQNERLGWYHYAAGIPAIIYACNLEQAIVILMAMFAFVCMVKFMRHEYNIPFVYIGIAVSLLSLAYIFTCPGNDNRFIEECEKNIPEFLQFSFIKKVCLGLLNVERHFIAKTDVVFTAAAVILVILVYKRTHHYWKTLVAFVPTAFLFAYSVLSRTFTFFGNVFFVSAESFEINWKSAVPLFILAAVIISMIYSIYQLMKDVPLQFWFMFILLGAGFASAVVMGFSPTLYLSSTRIFMYLYFILIYVVICCVVHAKENIKFSAAEKKLFKTALTVWAFANVCSISVEILTLWRAH